MPKTTPHPQSSSKAEELSKPTRKVHSPVPTVFEGRRSASSSFQGDGTDSTVIKWSQERRLQFIDFRLQWEGRINRRDLTEFFKISVPQASADIAQYAQLVPNNIAYDSSSRTYVATAGFAPQFDTSGARQYLSQLLALERHILSDDQAFLAVRPPIASVPLPSRTIESTTLALMLRAIAKKEMLQIRYQSIARNEEQERYISPHAFGYDGVRWHVRAFCHLRSGFRDFVFGRILSAKPPVASTVDSIDDREWHTTIDLVLVPDDSLTPEQRRGVEIDYAMKNGSVTVPCRQAMLFYTLRTLNFEPSGQPRYGERQLVIANLADIKPLLPMLGQP
jgi:predicted DNA-binding transcriptional regulator YafY